jgi:hypothetical protein
MLQVISNEIDSFLQFIQKCDNRFSLIYALFLNQNVVAMI